MMASNDNYQRNLARSLVESLGVDGALDVCRENQWEGVLRIIDKTYGEAPPEKTADGTQTRH